MAKWNESSSDTPKIETRTPEAPRVAPKEKPTETVTTDVSKPKTPREVVLAPNAEKVKSNNEPERLPAPGNDLRPSGIGSNKSANDAAAKSEQVKLPSAGETAKKIPDLPNSELANRAGIAEKTFNDILSLPRGSRPNPETYLDPKYVENHLNKFDVKQPNGTVDRQADRIIEKQVDEKGRNKLMEWGLSRDDGKVFVAPVGTPESQRALNSGSAGSEKQVISMSGLQNARLEMPSGNEKSDLTHWKPGGLTSKGEPEAVLNIGERPVAKMIEKLKPVSYPSELNAKGSASSETPPPASKKVEQTRKDF